MTLDRAVPRAAWIGLGIAIVAIVAAIAIPAATGWSVFANAFPPLHAQWAPHVGPGTIPAIVLAVLAIRFGVDVAARLTWRRLLLAAFAVALLWLVSLALVDGPSGLGAILNSRHEYLQTARSITDVSVTLHEYISRIPVDSVGQWPTHIAGHPPGAVLFFWVLVQLGLGGWASAGIIVILLGATTPVAVLVTLRRLGAEAAGRRALPFLVMGPAAIWMAVSADGMFAAFAAWGLTTLTLSATARRWWSGAGWGVASGLLLGYCVFLSYGLVLLGVLAVAVLIAARSWRPLPWAIGGAAAVVAGFAAGGFAWWQAYPVLVERYWAGIASRRPLGYWIWGNLAALAISAGPIVGAGLGVALVRARAIGDRLSEHRVTVLLTLAAAATILLADASGMSKAEVERIWLPFVPWLLLGTALLPERWRRWGFAGQIVFALVVQHLLFTGW
jgi:methylthioxylose transferase